MNLTINQSKLLHALLDKYENSKTYEGTNAVSQNFAVKPEKVWKDYVSDYASFHCFHVKDFFHLYSTKGTEFWYILHCKFH